MKLLLTLMLFLIASVSGIAEEAKKCSSFVKDINIESNLATASVIANKLNKVGSIRFETSHMLEEAEKNVLKVEKPTDLCPSNCDLPKEPIVVFKSVPNEFLSHYDESEKCGKLQEETEKNPLSYNNKDFPTLQSLEDWFGDFTRGKGADGKDLYERCSGKCSPQYECIISRNDDKFLLDAQVLCGQARDKNDNKYVLSYSYRWICQDKKG